MNPARVRFGQIWVDAVRLDEALAQVEVLVDDRCGGAVFTPNVDHVVIADRYPPLSAAYARADLSLCDGQPLRWASHLVGLALPERVAGADLFEPLMRVAARRRWRVFLLGGGLGVADAAADRLSRELGVVVVGCSAPRVDLAASPEEDEQIARIAAARPDLVVVCLGAPKGELWIDRARDRLAPAVALQLGASVDFFLGRVPRAPRWMRRAGLEWLYRLLREPRRLAYRYLLQDPVFLGVLARTLAAPRATRVLPAGSLRPADAGALPPHLA